jgi:hypothetical protein
MKRFAALLLLSACASDVADAPREVPPTDVLCQVWQGSGKIDSPNLLQGWGTNADDVQGILGEPTLKAGDAWIYEYCRGTLTVTFEVADLCTRDGTKVQPAFFVADVEADGFDDQACWILDQRNRAPTCDGCLPPWSVGPC